MQILTHIALSDKLAVYDVENQTIGWVQYNCSSSIKVRDNATGNAYDVVAHDISFDSTNLRADIVSTLMLVAVVLSLIV
ncbi:aspartic proteinase 36-like [Salvia splendens]|uniref:aspartic proteinase 36-like n=1 Tax=Salvia splendens TaxID=180675 RepID=UPI001C259F05|nr:aspartic proteinase 36-like [Salvia splendens]XP_042045392.1 aspartic proteinase 36-like [Salvia splendens]